MFFLCVIIVYAAGFSLCIIVGSVWCWLSHAKSEASFKVRGADRVEAFTADDVIAVALFWPIIGVISIHDGLKKLAVAFFIKKIKKEMEAKKLEG